VRWKLFFDQLDMEMAGKPSHPVNYFDAELRWANDTNTYTTIPRGNYLDVIKEIRLF
jgi:hypothetical protein